MSLQNRLDSLYRRGRKEADSLYRLGRKEAGRLYGDSAHWIEEHLPRLKREAEEARREASRDAQRGVRTARRRYDERLRAPVTWIEEHLPPTRTTASILVPTVIAAAGAGVAFWWWTQWARGQAERAAADAAGGAEGKAHPESVMAHTPPPSGGPVETPDASARKLSEPAEDVMAHAPPPPDVEPVGGTLSHPGPASSPSAGAPDASKLMTSASASPLQGGVEAVLPVAAAKSLDESLAVQAAKKPAARKAKPAGPALN